MFLQSNKSKAIFLGTIVVLCCVLECYFRFVLRAEIFYTHLFYIPIILAAFWWGLKGGFAAGLIFGFFYLSLEFLSVRAMSLGWVFTILIRSLMFMGIGLLSGVFGKEKINLDMHLNKIKNQLTKSGEELKGWSDVLEQRIQAKTEELFTLYKISKETSSTMDIKLLLKRVLEMIVPIIDADAGAVLLLDFEEFPKCWEKKGCGNKNCPAFKSSNLKCWSMSDSSFSRRSDFKKKMERCVKCKVFRELELNPVVTYGLNERVVSSFRTRIGEGFWGEAILQGKPIVEEVEDVFDSEDLVNIYLKGVKKLDSEVLKNLHKVKESDLKETKSLNLGKGKVKPFVPRTHITFPLTTEGEIIGALYLASAQARHYSGEEINMLSTVADRVAVAIENAQLHKETKILTITDDLTGLFNYRYFQDCLKKELKRAERYRRPLSLLILDVDDFKKYNDTYGHWAGNLALKSLAILLESNIREKVDIAARYGGEEFCLVMPETDKKAAIEVAERVRCAIEENDFDEEEMGIGSKLTVSMGIATYPDDAGDLENLIRNADIALYQAKEAGRNQICSFSKDG